MKITKLTTITSLLLVSSMLTGVTANALYTATTFDEDRFKEYIKIEEDYLFSSDERNYVAMYLIDGGNGSCSIQPVEKVNDQLQISIENAEQYNEIVEAINSVNENLVISKSESVYEDKVSVIVSDNDEFIDIRVSDIKEINNLIGDKVVYFHYLTGYYDYTPISYMYMTRYAFGSDETYLYNFDDLEVLKNYVKENNIDAEIVEITASPRRTEIDIVPNTELTMLEHYQLAVQIAKDTNIFPEGDSPQSINGTGGETIDIASYTNGDTNEDGYLTLADSVAILQSIGNPDRYGLSAQGEFNADVDGNAGITGADALVIQQMELGIL